MTTPYDTIKSALFGNPVDLNKKPSAVGVAKAFAEMQAYLDAAQAGALVFDTKANLLAVSSVPSANIMAWVVNDSTISNNGIYQNIGSAGTPSFVKRAEIPQYVVSGINVGAGTANAIQITTDKSIPTTDGKCLIIVPIVANNTASNPTLSINNGSTLTIVSNSGATIVAGGLTSGMNITGYISNSGTKFRLLSDQASAAIQAAAEAAASAAQGYAAIAEAAANAAGFVFDALTAVTSATIAASIKSFATRGYASAGDGGGWPLAIRVASQPSHAGKIRSVDRYLPNGSTDATNGGWWELITNTCCVEQFGGKALTQAQMVAAAGTINNTAANNTAFSNALAYMVARGGGICKALGQIYDLSTQLTRPSGVYLVGAGVGQWDPIYPSRPKTWEGTTLLFRGAGTKARTLAGITSMPDEGGWLEDPDSAGTYLKQFSAYNNDATGTTPATLKQFSAAILVDTGTRYGGLQHLRICNWVGTDGISDWSNTSNSSLGDDWDFGILRRNSEYSDDFNIQVVGGWREFADLMCTTVDTNAASERNRVVHARFQGRRGHGVRAPSMWQVTATTSNSITVHWNNEWYFASGGGNFKGSNNTTYTYTGITHSGTNATATFTGVSPDPSGAGLLHIRHASSGFGNSQYEDCMMHGLDHVSGIKANVLGYSDSKAFEIAGFPLRGMQYTKCKAHTGERSVGSFGVCSDITWIQGQFEGLGLLTALPQTTEQVSSAPVFDTRGLQMISCVGLSDQCDLRLFKPRQALITELSINPRGTIDKHLYLVPNRADADARLQSGAGASEIRLYAGGSMTFYTSSTSRFSLLPSGNLSPTTANTMYLGVSGSPLAGGYTQTAFSVTSDRNQKTLIGPHEAAILDAWAKVEWVRYKLNDAVALKGPDGARWHCGVVAQQIKETFEAHGLDACEYGLLCFAEWDEIPEITEYITDENGDIIEQRIVQPAIPAGSGWSVRYEEAEALENAFQRREIMRIKNALETLGINL